MKVIDILNKIANGEEVKFKTKVDDCIYELTEGAILYDITNKEVTRWFIDESWLNEEVEIIEEDKKIEHIGIPVIDGDNTCNELMKSINVITKDISNKINEIIERLNDLGK